MKIRHLSDYEIQRFTFDLAECEPDMIEHIHACELCKKRVETYASLSTVIKDLPEPILEYDLSALVLDRLPSAPEQETSYNYFIYFILISSVGLIISTLYFSIEIFFDLFGNTLSIQHYFVMSIAMLVAFVLGLDMFMSFHRKTTKLRNAT